MHAEQLQRGKGGCRCSPNARVDKSIPACQLDISHKVLRSVEHTAWKLNDILLQVCGWGDIIFSTQRQYETKISNMPSIYLRRMDSNIIADE